MENSNPARQIEPRDSAPSRARRPAPSNQEAILMKSEQVALPTIR